jgi:thiosulfate dehydrogenase [quinone] large subunit
MNKQKFVYVGLRLIMGFVFLWAFLDKTFGLGFATTPEKAWLSGGSPTTGFLSFGTKGPFAEIFQSLAGVALVDWLFMLGLLFVGLTLVFNKYLKWGALAGIVMMALMYLAVMPPENNPLVDEHVVYAFVLAVLAIHSRKV